MPTVIAYPDVEDVDRWLASKVRDEAFATIGVTGIRTFVDPTNPRRVGILADIPDMDAFLDARPVFKGHTLVVPRAHVVTLADVSGDLLAELFGAVRRFSPPRRRAQCRSNPS